MQEDATQTPEQKVTNVTETRDCSNWNQHARLTGTTITEPLWKITLATSQQVKHRLQCDPVIPHLGLHS